MPLPHDAKSFITLIQRSPDIGDGWRKLSPQLDDHFRSVIEKFPDLFQYDEHLPAVRLTERGQILMEYL